MCRNKFAVSLGHVVIVLLSSLIVVVKASSTSPRPVVAAVGRRSRLSACCQPCRPVVGAVRCRVAMVIDLRFAGISRYYSTRSSLNSLCLCEPQTSKLRSQVGQTLAALLSLSPWWQLCSYENPIFWLFLAPSNHHDHHF